MLNPAQSHMRNKYEVTLTVVTYLQDYMSLVACDDVLLWYHCNHVIQAASVSLSLCVYELLNCNVKWVCCMAVLMLQVSKTWKTRVLYKSIFFTVFYWLSDVKELVIAASKHDSDTR